MKFRMLLICVIILFTACNKDTEISAEMNETFYLSHEGADMPVFVRGNGQSNVFVLLLSGGPGDGGLKYRGHTYSDLLEKEYAMVYWDQRQQGNSHGHFKEGDLTIDLMVEDTHELIQTLKLRYGDDISVFLMGHSWGGLLGTAYMLKDDYQNDVNGWIEVDGAHDFPLINTAMIKMFNTIGQAELDAGNNVETWQEAIAYGNSLDTNNINFDQALKLNAYSGRVEKLMDQLNERSDPNLGVMELNFTGPNNPIAVDANALQLTDGLYAEIIEFSKTDELNKITIPTLLQWGKYDFKVPPALGETAFENINTPDKFLKIYDYSGHSPMRYEPELFVQDMITFIEAYK